MTAKRISVRIESRLEYRLRRKAARERKTESAIIREALQSYLQPDSGEPTAYDIATRAGLVGCAKRLPRDLSTNPKYLAGLGGSGCFASLWTLDL